MPRDRTPLRDARSFATWGLSYGLTRAVISRAHRAGDLVGALELDPGLREDPFPAYERLRAQGRVTDHGIVKATVDHAVATAILRSEHFGVGAGGGELPRPLQRLLYRLSDEEARGPVDPPSMLAVDPPDHTRYRRSVSRVFTARAVQRLADSTRETAEELLDAIEADIGRGSRAGRFDVVERYAALLPVAVISDVLGVPRSMRDRLLAWGNGAAVTLDPALSWRQYRVAERDLRAMHAWFAEHVAAVRRSPGDDLLSRLALLEGDDAMSEIELHATGLLVLGAGFETTVNLIGNAVHQLGRHPEQRAAVAADAGLWPAVVDETLRYDSPVQLTMRVCSRDTEIEGTRFAAREPVLMLIGGANRDPAVFDDPQRFDIGRRNPGDHLAFSSGIHFCLGAGLARMEAAVALEALYARFPDLTTTGLPTRRGTRVLRGYEHLPVRMTPAPRAVAV